MEGDGAPPPVRKLRTFVAVWPSDEVAGVLAGVARGDHEALRWTRPEQRHVTLSFLGKIEPTSLRVVGRVLRAGLEGAGRPVASLGPRTALLGPGVLCVPVEGLDELAGRVHRGLSQEGFGLEYRPFRGHVTLARSRRRRRVPGGLVGRPVEARWPVDQVTVVVSHPSPSGHHYEVVEQVALDGG